MLVDACAKKHGLSWRTSSKFNAKIARWDRAPSGACWLMKPTTFMNESGCSVRALAKFYRIPSPAIVVLCDDLTIEFGRIKITKAGGAGGHNGVASLLRELAVGFIRYRIGIGPKYPREANLTDFVLGQFNRQEQALFAQKLESYVNGLELLLHSGVDAAMNQLNRKNPP